MFSPKNYIIYTVVILRYPLLLSTEEKLAY